MPPLIENTMADQVKNDLSGLSAITVDVIADTSKANLAGPNATIVRTYLPEYDIEDKSKIRLTVIPRSVVSQSVSRRLIREDISIDVAIQKRITDDADGDIVSSVSQEVARFYETAARNVLIGSPRTVFLNSELLEVYSPERLNESAKEYATTIRLNFVTLRPQSGI